MQLLLMRHGSAARHGPYADIDRPLTARGEAQARAAACALAHLAFTPQRLFVSPAQRCRHTAEILVEQLQLSNDAIRVADEFAGGATPQQLLRVIANGAPAVERVLVIGHQPDLEALGSYVLVGGGDVSLLLEPGGCACFEGVSTGPPAVLRWLLTPKQLHHIASSDAGSSKEGS
jgi:phosphohistidine phosphatase